MSLPVFFISSPFFYFGIHMIKRKPVHVHTFFFSSEEIYYYIAMQPYIEPHCYPVQLP